jgi:hypothetical protein
MCHGVLYSREGSEFAETHTSLVLDGVALFGKAIILTVEAATR